MKITNLAIDRSTTVFVLLLIILVAGVYSYNALPRESEPEIVIPLVMVSVRYEGVSPEDMETLVTIPIERKLTGISGVKEITSESVEGASIIRIEFESDVIIEDALQKVRDKVDLADPDLPDEADEAVIYEINFSELPIMNVSLTGRVGLPVLTQLAEDLEDRIEAIKGVLDVEITGDIEREIQIEVDPDRVARYGVSLADLVLLVGVENVNTPGGALELGTAKYLMRVPGEFENPDDLNSLVVKKGEVGVVYLRDIATIRDGFKDRETYSRIDGVEAVTLRISKRAGENIIGISDSVKAELAHFRKGLPAGVDVLITEDESDDVRNMVNELESSILTGLILVLVVIFIFLGLANAFFVALAIPISMLITFAMLQLLGITLNMVVLFSLTLALGMLVDNGIVVVENIYRHLQQGESRFMAAKRGASEVAWPITASTITTIAAFFPMYFWPGIWGSFMVYLPKTVTLCLLASLFVGLIVNPALASVFMKVRKRDMRNPIEQERPRLSLPMRLYERFLRAALVYRFVTFTAAVTALVVIAQIFFAGAIIEFVPDTQPREAAIEVDCPEGTSLDTSNALALQIEAMAETQREGLEFVITTVGSQGGPFGKESGGTSHLSQVTVDFPPLHDATIRPKEIIGKIRGMLSEITGGHVRIEEEQQGPPGKMPVNIEITGDDFPTLAALAQDIRRMLKEVPGLVDLDDDYDRGKPEVQVQVDRERALLMNMNTQFIGLAVKTVVNGRKASDYRDGDDEYDVTVKFPPHFREDLSNIESMTLVNLDGRPIPFSAVASLEQGAGLGRITRIDRRRTVTVSADVAQGVNGNKTLAACQALLADFPLPPGYALAYTGENEDQQETQEFLGRAFVMGLLLIVLVLVTQFNSITQPMIIMSSVILSLAGVFLGLLIFDMPFGILMTGIGCISLAGVVVNNGIVLVDFINQERAEGMPMTEAIVQGGITRFRPVMLTAVTTILGLIPMAIGVSFDFRAFEWVVGGASSEWWGSMATAVIFGLAFATVLTLVVVPVLFSMSDSMAKVFSQPRERVDSSAAASATQD